MDSLHFCVIDGIKVQNKINKLIDNEKLELIKYNFVPEM